MTLITATKRFIKRAARFSVDTGASLVEYTLLVALIAAVAIGAVTFLGKSAEKTMCDTGTAIATGSNSGVTPDPGTCGTPAAP
jgi:Flp pilus assembly pilin Flp